MATPNGTTEPTTDATPDALEAVATVNTYEERASAAYKALLEGHDPRTVNRAYNREPTPADGEPEEEPAAKPEEATSRDASGETPEPKKDGQPAPKDSSDPAKAERVLIARRVLKRDGYEDDELDALSEERILAKAEVRAAHHKTLDRQLSKPSADITADPDDSDNPPARDEDDEIESIREYDPDLADKIVAKRKAVEEENAQLRRQLGVQRLQVIVSKTKVDYPELGDDKVLDTVLEKAKALARSDAYTSAEDAFSDACKLVLSPRREKSAQEKLLRNNREHRNGQIDTETVTDDGGNRAMTRDEKESHGFNLLSKGFSPAEVKSRLAKIPDA